MRNSKNVGLDDGCQKCFIFTGAGICGIGLLLMVILIPASIRNVKFDEYAIKYTRITRKVDNGTIYKEGKYITTPSTKMFRYSKIVNKLGIDLDCLTANGIVMDLEVDIQYQIPEDEVFNIFYTFGDPEVFEDFLELVASDSIRDTCGDYTAEGFYLNRTHIQGDISANVIKGFNITETNILLYVIILRSYSYPTILDNAIKEKRYAENDIEIAENERGGSIVEANTVLIEAQINAEQLIIQASAEVDSVLAEAYQQAEAIEELWEQRATFFSTVKTSLNMTADEFVDQYLTSVVLQNADTPVTGIES